MEKQAIRPKAYISARIIWLPWVIKMIAREENSVKKVNAVERLTAVGGDEPEKSIAMRCPLHQFAGGHKGGVNRHGQGEAG